MRMRTKTFGFAMLALFTIVLPSYFVREFMKVATDHAEDEAWNQQVEVESAKWAKSPAGKRRLAEQKREKELYKQATQAVLERHSLTSLSNDTTPPDPRLMNEIMEEMMALQRKK